MCVGPFDDDISSPAFLVGRRAATCGANTDRALCVRYIKRNRTGIAEGSVERLQSTGGLKGEPYGWEVGWSLVTGHFRLRVDN